MPNGTIWDLSGAPGTDRTNGANGNPVDNALDGRIARCHFFGDAPATHGQDGLHAPPAASGMDGTSGEPGKTLKLTVTTFEGGITFNAAGGRGGHGGNGGNGMNGANGGNGGGGDGCEGAGNGGKGGNGGAAGNGGRGGNGGAAGFVDLKYKNFHIGDMHYPIPGGAAGNGGKAGQPGAAGKGGMGGYGGCNFWGCEDNGHNGSNGNLGASGTDGAPGTAGPNGWFDQGAIA